MACTESKSIDCTMCARGVCALQSSSFEFVFYYNELSYLELRLATLAAYACSNNTLPLSVGRGGSSTGML